MDDAELERVARDVESEQVERKQSVAKKNSICESICAFANDLPNTQRPGFVLIGVSDGGDPVSLNVTDELLLEISDIRANGQLYPFPTMYVEKRRFEGSDIIVVTVQPSDSTPIRFNGRVYIRTGPSRRQASPEEERRLTEKRRAGDLSFDARPLPSATVDDLDLDLFRTDYLPGAVARDVLDANQRSVVDQLSSLRFGTPEGVPTVTGIIVVGTDSTAYVPGAYIQFLRLDGQELSSPIKDQKRIAGPLPQQLRDLDQVIRANVSTAVDLMESDREMEAPDYPIAALQQFTRNALMHRNYEGTAAPVRVTWFTDRIEIQSPGGPYGQVTVENFGTAGITDYRNPTVAEAMRSLGYVQRFGVGLQVAKAALAKNGNPPPDLEPHPENVLIVVRRRM